MSIGFENSTREKIKPIHYGLREIEIRAAKFHEKYGGTEEFSNIKNLVDELRKIMGRNKSTESLTGDALLAWNKNVEEINKLMTAEN